MYLLEDIGGGLRKAAAPHDRSRPPVCMSMTIGLHAENYAYLFDITARQG